MFRNKKNVPFPFFEKHIVQTIYEYVDLQEEKNLKKIQKHPFFYEACKGMHLLRHVAYGQQKEAEAILKETKDEKTRIELLILKADVTDPSGRIFHKITSFQYALWAFDKYMWEMLLKYFPREIAAQQIKELDESGVEYLKPKFQEMKAETIKNEKHFDFIPFLETLKYLTKNIQYMPYEKLEEYWVKKLGAEQIKLPMSVVNEYCQKKSFKKLPTFKEKTLARKSNFGESYGFKVWGSTDWYAKDRLGVNVGVVRYAFNKPLANGGWAMAGAFGRIKMCSEKDYLALETLFQIRMEEVNALRSQLLSHAVIDQPGTQFKYQWCDRK
jgi:hypothetical protein